MLSSIYEPAGLYVCSLATLILWPVPVRTMNDSPSLGAPES